MEVMMQPSNVKFVCSIGGIEITVSLPVYLLKQIEKYSQIPSRKKLTAQQIEDIVKKLTIQYAVFLHAVIQTGVFVEWGTSLLQKNVKNAADDLRRRCDLLKKLLAKTK
jgi:NADH:ubiquinone oxidoreductase subunit 4 (subunit M)